MNWTEGPAGMMIPAEKAKPPETPPPREIPEPLNDFAGGLNPDGSFLMCPEAYQKLREAFRWLDCGICPSGHRDRLQDVADELWLHQGIDFERYC